VLVRFEGSQLAVLDVKVPLPSSAAAPASKVHIFVDRSVLEVLINDTVSVTKTIPTFQPSGTLLVRADGGTATFKSIRTWPMQNIWSH